MLMLKHDLNTLQNQSSVKHEIEHEQFISGCIRGNLSPFQHRLHTLKRTASGLLNLLASVRSVDVVSVRLLVYSLLFIFYPFGTIENNRVLEESFAETFIQH